MLFGKISYLHPGSIVKYVEPSPVRPVQIKESGELYQIVESVLDKLFWSCLYNTGILFRWHFHIKLRFLTRTEFD